MLSLETQHFQLHLTVLQVIYGLSLSAAVIGWA